ncbi:MAG: GNAT family N-acetyltransferase [Azospirillum sp.]|nr:GNAT family N-acetyltransferase [Azospirillum sp.]
MNNGIADTRMRAASPFDAAALAAMQQACFPDEPWETAAFADLLPLPGCFGLIALTQAAALVQPKGFALCRVAADEAEILSIGVLPGWRRSGVAQCLLADASVLAAGRGAARMFLEVAADNLAARRLYCAAGFESVGLRKAYYRRGGHMVDAVVLKREL